jgi:DNA-binding transcriptional LysR family regulator
MAFRRIGRGREMESWDEFRTAFEVARHGTVSGAAESLGVHHATVIRHVDALERRLGARLFQRHARGYTPTEAGRDLLAVGQVTQDQLAQLVNRIRGRGESVGGELVVTSVGGLAALFVPVLAAFQAAHPGLVLRYLTGYRLFRLDFGEAHVAIRAGNPPREPDNVVQPFIRLPSALYASRGYVAAHGLPETDAALREHRFVIDDDPAARGPHNRWLRDTVPDERLAFRVSEPAALETAIRAGAGIGFLPARLGRAAPDLVEVRPPDPQWAAALWLVTHVDLHRSLKVQRFLAHLKAATRDWDAA